MRSTSSPEPADWRRRVSDVRRLLRRPTGLSERALNAGFWAYALRLSGRLLGTVRIVILARLLTPGDFGLLGVALLVMSMFETFTKTGFRAALIQRKGEIEQYFDTAWTLQVLRYSLKAIVLAAAAPWIGTFFDAPAAVPIIRVAAAGVFVEGLLNIGVVHFDKELEFQRRFVYRSIPPLVDLVVSVPLALLLRNVWALVLGLVASKVALVIASYIAHPYRPKLRVQWQQARELYRFGKWVFWSALLVYLLLHLDDLVVGRVLAVASLGLYQTAFSLSQVMTTELTSVLNQVALPTYAKLQDHKAKLRKAYLRTLQLVGLAAFPIAGGLWFVGPDLIRFFLGAQWLPMVGAFRVLLIWGLIRSILATTGPLMVAVGRPSVNTKLQLVQVASLGVLIYPLTLSGGIEGAAWATVLAAIVPDAGAVVMAFRTVGATRLDAARLLAVPAFSTGIMIAILYGIAGLTVIPDGGWLLVWGPAVGVLIYGLVVLTARRTVGYMSDGILT